MILQSNKIYIVYTSASDDACRAQSSQEHDGTEFHIAFLSHTLLETQRKWSTMEQKLTEFIMPLPNRIIISREQTL